MILVDEHEFYSTSSENNETPREMNKEYSSVKVCGSKENEFRNVIVLRQNGRRKHDTSVIQVERSIEATNTI